MPLCSLDELFTIAEETPFLEKLDKSFRGKEGSQVARQWTTRGYISKLIQDAGVQIDRQMSGYDAGDPPPGPETARLHAKYEPVTRERMHSVLQNTYACLEGSRLKDEEKRDMGNSLKKIMEKLQVPLEPEAEVSRSKSPGFGPAM